MEKNKAEEGGWAALWGRCNFKVAGLSLSEKVPAESIL